MKNSRSGNYVYKSDGAGGEEAQVKVHRTQVLIVGSGFSGMGMAIQLLKAGIDDFLLIEKETEIGGTWRDNTYPGCACDVPSHMYSYSFEPKPDWSQLWAGQDEIQNYLTGLARKYDLYRRTHFGRALQSGHWDSDDSAWHLVTSDGHEYIARFVVSGVGALHIPSIPKIEGQQNFGGTVFHSAQWDHDCSLAGKKVAVIGTGASAIQFIPEIAKVVSELHVYQRTPAWVLPRKNIKFPKAVRALFTRVPILAKGLRTAVYWSAESLSVGLNGHLNLMRPLESIAKWNIAQGIDDPVLRTKLTPSYRIGCKRILGSSDYYPALNRPTTTVITDGISEIAEGAIVSRTGEKRPVDVIIYATGFHVTDGFESLRLKGASGKELASVWSDEGIQTHLGITTAGFPNLFFLLGPNTGLGHNSVVFMIECQIRYIISAIRLVKERGAAALEVREPVQRKFNSEIQRKLVKGVWSSGGCTSWYLDAQGVNRTVWPGFTWQYWRRTRKLAASDFGFVGESAPAHRSVDASNSPGKENLPK
ncbi:NAD(P)/FAD-dependent oxidoreductase [Nocardia puris]|uniref:flavin-containing monooxygenase n=1 Tax=Nocardia TaxID=1817 RepID=UPI0009DFA0E3|nr:MULTISPECIES: NAD(P)/FAD-dependent oxidoreductase [Nocardia]MBF6137193.1 NAD(P)/FAD-dependent oxidoreductase [Nocardia otitidiscaviarum]MBF6181797.1 NAD(P)/FAD-dependent oxidoreductase [Nocardia otitidiscaviarum]MBF6461689.1 NAD(P)/FAD-dependent oxidoreductase [Nocardia puris]MBF6488091.1 NAD(P)/FAD-dependent oxidoreductase [Nocardia otitidiscaviarum]